MEKISVYTLTIILVFTLYSASLFSQEKTTIRPSMALQYIKVNDIVTLQAKLTWSGESGELPLPGREISFYTGSGSKLLASIATDASGTAIFALDNNAKLPSDNQGSWKFSSEFKGSDTIDAATAEVSVKNVMLEMTLTLVDSVKTVTLTAYTEENGKKTAVKGETVNVFVPRMFSNLPVGDIILDETGAGKVEFPNDIPGDKDGNLIIAARFFEHPSFGTVERKITEKWGTVNSFSVPVMHRALWTKTAPMWMIITLSVLLTGVWGHYMFAVISLILIRIDAKRKKAKDEYKL